MAGIRNSRWVRVSKSRCCPICERPDWCLITGPDGNPTAAICARIESDKRCGEAGWLHRLRDDDDWQPTRRRVIRFDKPKPAQIDFERFAADCQRCAAGQRVADLAATLGLSVDALQRLRVGWSECHRAWTFPMSNAGGDVLGIRLRRPNGFKFSVSGGRDGLFIPTDLRDAGALFVAEGPTDCAALLDLGFNAVGRPSCTGGTKLLVDLVKRRRPAQVVIVSDVDAHERGQRGAENLAAVLVAYAASVRIIAPASGKDAREWKQRGAMHGDIQAAIDVAPVRRLAVKGR